jgi:hypothetical protein
LGRYTFLKDGVLLKNISKIIYVLILCGLSFWAGKQFADTSKYNDVIEGYITFSDVLISNKNIEVISLIRFYKQNEKSPEEAKEYLKRIIAMRYTRPERYKNAIGSSYGAEFNLYATNKEIEEFLLKHPIDFCKNSSKETMLKCNLDNFLED